ncbi:hypothetical protein SAMN05421809_0942 [Natronorubrum daqingense]|uniref:Uncharacterized protein n=1 Tax=Natronorubrum daqingense TaxID=588898 RepID=A0A1N6ZWF9_9EURY|nr:hypothetical protein SAMN05421809_0942 [Natronorubrum daqingense]
MVVSSRVEPRSIRWLVRTHRCHLNTKWLRTVDRRTSGAFLRQCTSTDHRLSDFAVPRSIVASELSLSKHTHTILPAPSPTGPRHRIDTIDDVPSERVTLCSGVLLSAWRILAANRFRERDRRRRGGVSTLDSWVRAFSSVFADSRGNPQLRSSTSSPAIRVASHARPLRPSPDSFYSCSVISIEECKLGRSIDVRVGRPVISTNSNRDVPVVGRLIVSRSR